MVAQIALEPMGTEHRHKSRTRSNLPFWPLTSDGKQRIHKKIGNIPSALLNALYDRNAGTSGCSQG
jgi:hypothetical protein